jgi:two-component system, OmpR family, sensor histidine kinase MprB
VQDEVAVQNTHGRAKDVHFELEATPCWVVASDDGLRRAVGNLLDNARKWSPAGEPVSVECHEGTVVVRDHGPGIAEADLPHIFDRFYRSPAARGLPGSGLGLAIVAQVVKAEGGTIVAENDPRGGARMSMHLPTVAGPAEPAPAQPPAELPAELLPPPPAQVEPGPGADAPTGTHTGTD